MNKWQSRNMKDPYVKLRDQVGVISRAYFKIEHIDEKFRLFKLHHQVLELGAAPGGWTEYLRTKVKHICALDLLPMGVSYANVDFYQCSIFDLPPQILEKKFHIILSDMAPNMTGNKTVDQGNMSNLLDAIIDNMETNLIPGGAVVAKVFQGVYGDVFLQDIRKKFKTINIFKPPSSRKDSTEIYVIAQGFKPLTVMVR